MAEERETPFGQKFQDNTGVFITGTPIVMQRMTDAEHEALGMALRNSARIGTPLVMDPRTTTFMPDGISLDEYDSEINSQVVDAVKSIPTHY